MESIHRFEDSPAHGLPMSRFQLSAPQPCKSKMPHGLPRCKLVQSVESCSRLDAKRHQAARSTCWVCRCFVFLHHRQRSGKIRVAKQHNTRVPQTYGNRCPYACGPCDRAQLTLKVCKLPLNSWLVRAPTLQVQTCDARRASVIRHDRDRRNASDRREPANTQKRRSRTDLDKQARTLGRQRRSRTQDSRAQSCLDCNMYAVSDLTH